MINLLEETIQCLNENGKSENDVLWIGFGYDKDENPLYKTTWEDFSENANFDYDNGYGGAKIPDDLIIVGKDFWLERHEYDGAEWWEFKTMPKEPKEQKKIIIKID